jgi:class 3 adenylate cyclase/tetratricopeptide (TPR) repeat protein
MCPSCGSPVPPRARFCLECGAALSGTQQAAQPGAARMTANGDAAPGDTVQTAPLAERRLVSVLFADLVGFTTYSQSRDPEDVRELLSRYFEACSSLVERYGGVVEKFIGDAVMAVWGAPVAQEDDAERAVRTALDVVDAVASLGLEVGAAGLAARAGVLTGEAAVTLGAKGQGMVAGDLVNTASRIQSAAEPGTVLVGEATRRSSDAAIAYEDAGRHSLKGKDAPVHLYRALRVVAGVGGLMKSEGLEPPFVGRDRELKLVKDLFHASTEAGRAQLVQVTGIAGIGKSRLVWEFFKYMDGLRSTYLWHRGRCLAYGEGVTYWALAEMVRGRAGILEGEERGSALDKLRRALDTYVPDPDDRRFIEPRLSQLIGLEERASSDRQELFSAWRLFFERLTDQTPVVMVFEDMQWADPSLLEFLGLLLERSKSQPIFVMALARPETAAAALGATQRNATFIHLEPLSIDEMRDLLAGFSPGLPEDLTVRILERAEGVPLYAVETVRMLLDRGLLVQEGPVYRPTGPVGSLEVPESLHALVAARLDGLLPEERRFVQTASVLGKSFTKQSLSVLAGSDDDALDGVLASLVAKEVLTIHADPRSSERGQYGFVQDLMRTVAYETLSRHDRRRLHLEAAAYLEAAWGAEEEEIVEVVAAHLLDAWRLDESADDAEDIKARAKAMLVRAGDRAASLGAPLEALGYYDQAATLSDETLQQAELIEQGAQMASLAGHNEDAIRYFDQATTKFAAAGDDRRAALSQARLASAEYELGDLERALERMSAARAAIAGGPPDQSLATVTAQMGRFLALMGRPSEALPVLDEALTLAEHLDLPEVFAEALASRAVALMYSGRLGEGIVLLQKSLELALEREAYRTAIRAYRNIVATLANLDRFAEALEMVTASAVLARRIGAMGHEVSFRLEMAGELCRLGRWDEALEIASEVQHASQDGPPDPSARSLLLELVPVFIGRNALDEARRILDDAARDEHSAQVDYRAAYQMYSAMVLRAEGRLREAIEQGSAVAQNELGLTHTYTKIGIVVAVDSALDAGDVEQAESMLTPVESALPGEVTPWLRAQIARLRARVDTRRGVTSEVERGYVAAEEGLRRIGVPFDLAVALSEHAEWLVSVGRDGDAEAPFSEAAGIFEQLGATAGLERIVGPRRPSAAPARH